jgi:NTP pyrophosphatase (non-canonical NTP hydrolase)
MEQRIITIKDAQQAVKKFALNNGWSDTPNVDKFDHLHEELVEMSKILRYKSEEERISAVKEHNEEFVDGIGDLFFALCRLANQLDVDIEDAFNLVKDRVFAKYNGAKTESKPKFTR